MAFIEEFNREGNKSFSVAMNQHGDLTPEEFARLYMGQLSPTSQEELQQRIAREASTTDDLYDPTAHHEVRSSIPFSWDWRTKGTPLPHKPGHHGLYEYLPCQRFPVGAGRRSDGGEEPGLVRELLGLRGYRRH